MATVKWTVPAQMVRKKFYLQGMRDLKNNYMINYMGNYMVITCLNKEHELPRMSHELNIN